ncbi:hypothetical protein B0H13DRAFT_2306500 [Mycena leptocephala]|nr:hypothetical protein B0H13DRAFT_2306500 [Mycena leptocephala]
MSRQLATFARKMGDCEPLVIAIATNDVPRINALLSVQGLRSMKGFTKFENDLSLLIYRIGGHSLIYSINHALGPPSIRTIVNSAHFVKIAPTLGPIPIDEIRKNIKKPGIVLMMDECALEEATVHFPSQNQVDGLCQKYSGSIPSTLETYKSALTIVDALHEDKDHFGKEMALVAVKFVSEPNIYPILAAPTCKQSTYEDMIALKNMILDAWEELAEAMCGPIKNFSTDEDGLRRKAGHKMFFKDELLPSDPLFQTLTNLIRNESVYWHKTCPTNIRLI